MFYVITIYILYNPAKGPLFVMISFNKERSSCFHFVIFVCFIFVIDKNNRVESNQIENSTPLSFPPSLLLSQLPSLYLSSLTSLCPYLLPSLSHPHSPYGDPLKIKNQKGKRSLIPKYFTTAAYLLLPEEPYVLTDIYHC